MSLGNTILLINLTAAWFMTGLIWFVQIVHYPLFSAVGGEAFRPYHGRHVQRTTWVVAPVMLLELATALALPWLRPAAVPGWVAWVGLALLAVAWTSTGLLQIPRHHELAARYGEGAYAALCRTNWIRTAAWTARGILAAYAVGRTLNP